MTYYPSDAKPSQGLYYMCTLMGGPLLRSAVVVVRTCASHRHGHMHDNLSGGGHHIVIHKASETVRFTVRDEKLPDAMSGREYEYVANISNWRSLHTYCTLLYCAVRPSRLVLDREISPP